MPTSHSTEVRFNAVKHGLAAEGICEVDDPGSYKALCRRLKRQYEPYGLVEQFLVERIALNITRVRRAAKTRGRMFGGTTGPNVSHSQAIVRPFVLLYVDGVHVALRPACKFILAIPGQGVFANSRGDL
jgi:hypothetical protein